MRGCPQGRCGPATVSGSVFAKVRSLGETLGRRMDTMNWSQENCLIDNRREKLTWFGFLEPTSDGDGDSADAFRVAVFFSIILKYARTEMYHICRPFPTSRKEACLLL